MTAHYIHLSYEEFKSVERQMRAFEETSHKTEGGFYHKSIRISINDGLVMEFHGPLVGGYGHAQDSPSLRDLAQKIDPEGQLTQALDFLEWLGTKESEQNEDDTPPKKPRRRRAAASREEDKPADEGSDSGKSELRRRRRPTDDAGEVSSSDEAKPKRRRRTKAQMEEARATEAPVDAVDAVESTEELSAEDVGKAASDAAQKTSPDAVKEILAEFGVGFVNELTQEQRIEFVEMLK